MFRFGWCFFFLRRKNEKQKKSLHIHHGSAKLFQFKKHPLKLKVHVSHSHIDTHTHIAPLFFSPISLLYRFSLLFLSSGRPKKDTKQNQTQRNVKNIYTYRHNHLRFTIPNSSDLALFSSRLPRSSSHLGRFSIPDSRFSARLPMDSGSASAENNIRGLPTHGGRYVQYNVYGNLFEVSRKYVPPIRPVGRGAYGIVW